MSQEGPILVIINASPHRTGGFSYTIKRDVEQPIHYRSFQQLQLHLKHQDELQ